MLTTPIQNIGFLGGSTCKESACNAEDPGSIPGLGRSPGERKATHSSMVAWTRPRIGAAAKRSHPTSEVRGSGPEEPPHVQGAAAT